MRLILCAVLGMALTAAFADHAAAGSGKKRNKALYCSNGYCTSVPPRATQRKQQRGYLPPRRGSEYDYPRFGTERWWQLQEDQD